MSAIFLLSDFDLTWQRRFWSPETGWLWKNHPAVQFLYRFGTWPTLIVGIASGLVWIGSMGTGRWKHFRPVSSFLSLLLLIGPGLLVNTVVKDHFGRPRPIQTAGFGGKLSFHVLGEPGFGSGGRSFPCGHASMGFYWLGLFVYFWSRRRGIAWAFLGLGLVHGGIMGLGRMAQGGHWPSDVLWSAGFVYLTAWVIHRFATRGSAAGGSPEACGEGGAS
jgi:membrane-associated PAP2 superfamily phosphatase